MSVAADPNAAVNDLADRFWEGILERDPMWATMLGDERYNDRWPDLGEAGRAADEAAFRETLDEASRIPAESLAPEQVITRDLLVLVCENHLWSIPADEVRALRRREGWIDWLVAQLGEEMVGPAGHLVFGGEAEAA